MREKNRRLETIHANTYTNRRYDEDSFSFDLLKRQYWITCHDTQWQLYSRHDYREQTKHR